MKKIAVVFLTAITMIFFCACGAESDNHSTTEAPEATATDNTDDANKQTIGIYTIDMDNMNVAPVNVKMSTKKPTAEQIVNAVTENLDLTVEVKNVIRKNDTIYISFSKGKPPVRDCSSQVEEMILDCYANSVLDNVSSCKNIVFRCEGKAYDGGHLSFDIDEIYASK